MQVVLHRGACDNPPNRWVPALYNDKKLARVRRLEAKGCDTPAGVLSTEAPVVVRRVLAGRIGPAFGWRNLCCSSTSASIAGNGCAKCFSAQLHLSLSSCQRILQQNDTAHSRAPMSTNKGVARSGARPGAGGVLQAIKMPPAPGRVPPAPRRVDVMLGFKYTHLGVDFRVYTRLLYQAAPAPRGPAAAAREPHGNTQFELGMYRRF